MLKWKVPKIESESFWKNGEGLIDWWSEDLDYSVGFRCSLSNFVLGVLVSIGRKYFSVGILCFRISFHRY